MPYDKLIDDYAAGPHLLREAVRGMSHEQMAARPVPGKWSTLEVVCHIADFEIVGADRIKRVIAEDEPTLPDGDEKAFAAKLAYHDRDLEQELQLIGAIRGQVARILKTLSDADFARVAVHSTAGPMTLQQFVERAVNHIPHHIAFIAEKRKALGI
jgi:DinB family protein